MFQVLDAILESFHFRIEGADCGAVTSLTHFDWRRPGVKRGEQFRFDALELHVDPPFVVIGESHRFDYNAVQ